MNAREARRLTEENSAPLAEAVKTIEDFIKKAAEEGTSKISISFQLVESNGITNKKEKEELERHFKSKGFIVYYNEYEDTVNLRW